MDLVSSLIAYILLFIVILIIFYRTNRSIWACILFSIIIDLIFLLIIYPPSRLDPMSTYTESASAIYLFILCFSPIYIIGFALKKAYSDFNAHSHLHHHNHNM